jgi:hypothetical protein
LPRGAFDLDDTPKLESLRAAVRAAIDDFVQHADREREFLFKDVELMNAQQDLPRLQDLATLLVVAAMLGEI